MILRIFFRQYTAMAVLITASTLAFGQWTNIGSLPGKHYRLLSFPTEEHGFAITKDSGSSENGFFGTTNGGLSWKAIELNNPAFSSADFRSIFFLDQNTGYLAFRAFHTALKPFLYKTVDAGITWIDVTPIDLPLGDGAMDVYFTDFNQGFLTSGNHVFRTINGAQDWSSQRLGAFSGLREIDFYDADNGIIGAWDGSFAYQGIIYTTSNGGLSWDSLYLNKNYTSIENVDFISSSVAYAATGIFTPVSEFLFKTVDGGLTWDTLSLDFLADSSDKVMDVFFENDRTGYLCTVAGFIYKTTDGGNSWSVEHKNPLELKVIVSNGKRIFVGGLLNALLIKDLPIGLPTVEEPLENELFPVPVKRNEHLYFTKEQDGEILIIDMKGRLVSSISMRKSNSINLSELNLVPGSYFVKFSKNPDKGTVIIVE